MIETDSPAGTIGGNGKKVADFWIGKTPCWDFLGCTERVYSDCAAYHDRERPCWEVAGTQCRKILNFDWECRDCKVFMTWSLRD